MDDSSSGSRLLRGLHGLPLTAATVASLLTREELYALCSRFAVGASLKGGAAASKLELGAVVLRLVQSGRLGPLPTAAPPSAVVGEQGAAVGGGEVGRGGGRALPAALLESFTHAPSFDEGAHIRDSQSVSVYLSEEEGAGGGGGAAPAAAPLPPQLSLRAVVAATAQAVAAAAVAGRKQPRSTSLEGGGRKKDGADVGTQTQLLPISVGTQTGW